MPERMMWVAWEDGADLSNSQKSPGDYSPLTRDAERRLGHVVLSDIDDDDGLGAGPEPLDPDGEDEYSDSEADRQSNVSDVVAEVMAKAAADLIFRFIDDAVEAAKPHVAHWWNDQARPAIKAAAQTTRKRFRKAARRTPDDAGMISFEVATTDDPSTRLGAADEGAAVMTTVEAEQRLTAALVARAFSDEQVRTVLNARVLDDEQREVQLSLKEVPREEIQVQVNRLLEANPTMLASLIELFAETQHSGESALLRPGQAPSELDLPASGRPEHGDGRIPPDK